MAKTDKLTIAKVIETLKYYDGMVYLTAKALRVVPATIYNYVNKYPEVRAAKEGSEGEMLDLAERKLRSAIRKGSLQAIKFVLATKGSSRGYIERKEITGKDGAPLTDGHVLRVIEHTDDENGVG